MSDLSTPRINVDVDGEDVVVYFSWSCARYERAVHVSRADGRASLSLSRDGARDLQRKLGEGLDKQDWADAGHPGEEELMAEAEARGDPQVPPERVQEVKDAAREQIEAARSTS